MRCCKLLRPLDNNHIVVKKPEGMCERRCHYPTGAFMGWTTIQRDRLLVRWPMRRPGRHTRQVISLGQDPRTAGSFLHRLRGTAVCTTGGKIVETRDQTVSWRVLGSEFDVDCEVVLNPAAEGQVTTDPGGWVKNDRCGVVGLVNSQGHQGKAHPKSNVCCRRWRPHRSACQSRRVRSSGRP